MQKKIEDYLHLYIGCEVVSKYGTNAQKTYTMAGVEKLEELKVVVWDEEYGLILKSQSNNDFKPILRRLSDMTEEEKTYFVKDGNDLDPRFVINEKHFEHKHDSMKKYYYDALTAADNDMDLRLGPGWYFKHTPYLLSRGFDLFGLIDSGLAIDKNTLNPLRNE